MDDGFIAKPLGKKQIDQAFPIIQTISPDLAVEQWRSFAAALIGTACLDQHPRSRQQSPGRTADGDPGPRTGVSGSPVGRTGIMTVQNPHGYIHGLFSYGIAEDLRHGRTLTADNFIVLDLFDTAGAAGVLLRAMEDVAHRLGCSAIHANLPDSHAAMPQYRSALLGYFQAAGHAAEALRLCKPLAGGR